MKPTCVYLASAFLIASLTAKSHASGFDFAFNGPGVSGTVQLTYGTATDSKYSSAFEITGISGTFSDTKLSIVDAHITSLVPINHATPEPTNLLAPNDFSRFAVASGLPAQSHGFITYDNLLYPDGSPQTATDYPFHGGFLDIYGLLFGIQGGDVVDLWSYGVLPHSTSPSYGVAVATSDLSLDYVGGVTATTPEPNSLYLLATGALGLVLRRRAFLRSAS